MNERIHELAEQATTYIEPTATSGEGWIFDKEKFAELIVQECVHALWTEECRTNAMTQADYERGGNRIHKHFWSCRMIEGFDHVGSTHQCNVCKCEFTDDEGGVLGHFGILPVAFCPTCYSSMVDMVTQDMDFGEE